MPNDASRNLHDTDSASRAHAIRTRDTKGARRPSESYRIFISYPTEDAKLAEAICDTLLKINPTQVQIDLMGNFTIGRDYRKGIDSSLARADLLLLVFTGQYRPSPSWVGYEVGFFSSEILRCPRRLPDQSDVERMIVPINFFGKRAGPVDVIQGVEFAESQVIRPKISSETNGIVSGKEAVKEREKDPFYRLFKKVASDAEVFSGLARFDHDWEVRNNNIWDETVELYGILRDQLRHREREDE